MVCPVKKDTVKWYDGFKFGNHSDIYNPWSITDFLKEKTDKSILGIYQLKRSW